MQRMNKMKSLNYLWNYCFISNDNAKNSMQNKISVIKNKYQNLSEETIKDLLARHDGDVENTLKLPKIKVKQEQEKERGRG